MLKKILVAAALFGLVMTAKADEGQKITSKVQKVTLFLKGAQVTRTALVNIGAGNYDLIFGGISPEVDEKSIQVNAGGDFTILSVKHELNYLNGQVNTKQLETLMQAQNVIKAKIEEQNNLLAIYRSEENTLMKNEYVRVETNTFDAVKLKQALDFQTSRLTTIKGKELTLTNQISMLSDEVQRYNQQIEEVNNKAQTNIATSNIVVTISSQSALQASFTLNYIIRSARWVPNYDVRAKNVNSPIAVVFKASVSQQSGEDWKNIKLTLSTGNPSVNKIKPELTPYFLTLAPVSPNKENKITNVSGRVTSRDDGLPIPGVTVTIKGTSTATQTNNNGNYSIVIPPGSQALVYSFIGYQSKELPLSSSLMDVALNVSSNNLSEMVVTSNLGIKRESKTLGYSVAQVSGYSNPLEVNQIENQTSFEYNIVNPYSVPSNGKQYLVEISQTEVKATYQYFTAPKLSTDVFLTAQATDLNKYNFLSGEANLFFEGTYIGKSVLDTHALNDTLNLSFGVDKNIQVTRTLQKGLIEKASFGSSRRETKTWIVGVKNHKNQKINLLVEDQVPVSQISAIEVETQQTPGGKIDPLTGKISWNLVLASQADKKLQLKYVVKYPKNQLLTVQ